MSRIDRLKMGARRIARRRAVTDRAVAAGFGSNLCAVLARPSGALPVVLGSRLRLPLKSVQVSQWKGL